MRRSCFVLVVGCSILVGCCLRSEGEPDGGAGEPDGGFEDAGALDAGDCGGRCLPGRCDPATGNCSLPPACDGVQCLPTTACDPSDGICKCGGSTYPEAVPDCSRTDAGCSPSCAQGPGPRIVNPGRAIINQVSYQPWEIQLQATCGVPPYQWDPEQGPTPWPDATLDQTGQLRGGPAQPTACPEPLTVLVSDQQGLTDRATFYLIIAPDGG
jgi:hypothetical protein